MIGEAVESLPELVNSNTTKSAAGSDRTYSTVCRTAELCLDLPCLVHGTRSAAVEVQSKQDALVEGGTDWLSLVNEYCDDFAQSLGVNATSPDFDAGFARSCCRDGACGALDFSITRDVDDVLEQGVKSENTIYLVSMIFVVLICFVYPLTKRMNVGKEEMQERKHHNRREISVALSIVPDAKVLLAKHNILGQSVNTLPKVVPVGGGGRGRGSQTGTPLSLPDPSFQLHRL
jgi:hypothetical protein